jgi:hypothetical protein
VHTYLFPVIPLLLVAPKWQAIEQATGSWGPSRSLRMLMENFTAPSEGGGGAAARVELGDGDVGFGAGGGTKKATWQGLMMQRRRWWIGEQGDLNMWTSRCGEGGPRLAEAQGVASPHHAPPQAQPPPPLGRLPLRVRWRRGRRCVGRG